MALNTFSCLLNALHRVCDLPKMEQAATTRERRASSAVQRSAAFPEAAAMPNPWTKKNPMLSLVLSGANAWAGAARGLWTKEAQRQQVASTRAAAKQAASFWTAALMPPGGSGGKKKRRR